MADIRIQAGGYEFEAELKREGDHCSIVTHGKMVLVALQVADQLAKEGIRLDVVDLRTIRPMDVEAITASVRKTNRCVVLEEGWEVCGVGAQVVYLPVDPEEQRRRIARRSEADPAQFQMSDAELEQWRVQFEEPDDEELQGGPIPAVPSPHVSWSEWASERWPSSVDRPLP